MAREAMKKCVSCGASLRRGSVPGKWLDDHGGSVCDAEFEYDGGGHYPTSLRRATYHYVKGERQEVWVRPDLREKVK